jgi:hypothetical protein
MRVSDRIYQRTISRETKTKDQNSKTERTNNHHSFMKSLTNIHQVNTPGMNGAARASDTKVRLTKESAKYWRISLDNPPLNLIGPNEVRELTHLMDQIEADPVVQVIVIDSAVSGYFSAHYDLLAPLVDSTSMAPGPTGLHPVPDFMVRLSRLPVI